MSLRSRRKFIPKPQAVEPEPTPVVEQAPVTRRPVRKPILPKKGIVPETPKEQEPLPKSSIDVRFMGETVKVPVERALPKKTVRKPVLPKPKPGVYAQIVESPMRAVPPVELPTYDRPIIEVINQRRRQIIVHSVLYYRMNTNIVSDHDFDRWCNELVSLQLTYPTESKEGVFYEEFKDFDGTTGFHLSDNVWGIGKAQQLLQYHRKGVKA